MQEGRALPDGPRMQCVADVHTAAAGTYNTVVLVEDTDELTERSDVVQSMQLGNPKRNV
jgi:hypothetical protein